MKYKNVVWDWNGTLLNDAAIGCVVLNRMLAKRALPLLTESEYKEIFCFPVIDFYKEIGFDFDKESFHDISVEFVNEYAACSKDGLCLAKGAVETLSGLKDANVKIYALSALNETELNIEIKKLDLKNFFDEICGSNDIYASGKTERGLKMVADFGIIPNETLMVGDTVHDAEVAKAIGFDILLYSGGHNDLKRLKATAPVIDSLLDVLTYIKK